MFWVIRFTVVFLVGLPLLNGSPPELMVEGVEHDASPSSVANDIERPRLDYLAGYRRVESRLNKLDVDHKQFLENKKKAESTDRNERATPTESSSPAHQNVELESKALKAALTAIACQTRAFQSLRQGKVKEAATEVRRAMDAEGATQHLQQDLILGKYQTFDPYNTDAYKQKLEEFKRASNTYTAIPTVEEVTRGLEQLRESRRQLEDGWKVETLTRFGVVWRKFCQIVEGQNDVILQQRKESAVIEATRARTHEKLAQRALDQGQLVEAFHHLQIGRAAHIQAKHLRQTWLTIGGVLGSHTSSSLTEDGMYLTQEHHIVQQKPLLYSLDDMLFA